MEGIYPVKAGALAEGGQLLERRLEEILGNGVERVILGCTEIPVALEQLDGRHRAFAVDATGALADACIDWHRNLKTSGRAA
ncbi:hypothetical protein GCM10011348_33750 [Marinobacterium nitratireducens]|uniref:Aspartate racemase n=1 Tax=Marinobacterium nitratireducens TaxID=518897 RepID=A0A918DWS9_9GAMM|nr:aspartate/glutamate racemase family protein [Marinobacterium nitratireducens]GGO85372.1 hypothetical protein GCM10011348_33750 [Marinobacterium nitratireducens]